LLIATSLITGVLDVFLTPLRWGTHILPLAVPLAILGNVLLVTLARKGLRSGGFGFAVLVAWVLPVIVLPMWPRPEGDVVVPAGGSEQWVYFATLLLGAAAGIVAQFWADPSYRRGFDRLISR
jgi:hypothetical protein